MPKKRDRYDYSGGKKYRESYGYVPKSKSVGTQTSVQNLKNEMKILKDSFEKKTHITVIPGGPLAAGVVTPVTLIPQNSTSIGRDGNKVKCYSIALGGNVSLAPDKTSVVGRICLIIDHNNDGVAPNILSIWKDVVSFTTGLPRNLATGQSASYKRFTILWDYKYTLNPSGYAGGINSSDVLIVDILGSQEIVPQYYKRIFHYIAFKGTAADQASQRQGSMYVLTSARNDDKVVLDMECIFKYTDN